MAVWDTSGTLRKPKISIGIPYETRITVMWAMKTLGPLLFIPVPFCDKFPQMCRGFPLPLKRDKIVEMTLADPTMTHLLFVDTDSVCEKPSDPNQALQTLLQINEPIVSALYRAKQATGFNPAMWVEAVEPGTGKKGYTPIQQWTGNWIQADTIGMGFCLIKREVFEKIPPPWFPWERLEPSEDFSFCVKAKAAGYKINVFTDVQVSHIGDLIVHPDGHITTLEV